MDSYTQINWPAELLEEAGLPNIGYPVPVEAMDEILSAGGQVGYDWMLYWLQVFSEQQSDGWQELEPAMHRLTELLAAEDDRETATLESEDWFFEVAPIDLASFIVTIQRGGHVLAALAPREGGTLRVAVYRPLDGKALRYLFGLSKIPHPDHGVCMRPNNWEFAKDSACSSSSVYSYSGGSAHLSIWEYGLGINGDRTEDEHFMPQRDLKPLPPNLVAAQIGTYYQLCPEDRII